MPEGFESLSEHAGDVRDELERLRAQIAANEAADALQEEESDEPRETDEASTESDEQVRKILTEGLTPAVKKYVEAVQGIEVESSHLARNERFAKFLEIKNALVDEALSGIDLDPAALVSGLTEGRVTLDSLRQMTVTDTNDEKEALRSVMTLGEKVREGLGSFLEKSGLGRMAEGFGMDVSSLFPLLIPLLAGKLDAMGATPGMTFFRNAAFKMRAYEAREQAKAEGYDRETISAAMPAWETAYKEWMKNPPESAGPPPDFSSMIAQQAAETAQQEQERVQTEAREELASAFREYATTHGLLPGTSAIEVTESEATLERKDGGITARLPEAAFAKQEDGSFTLTAQGEALRNLLPVIAEHENVKTITPSDTLEVSGGEQGIDVKASIDGTNMTQERLAHALTFLPSTRIRSVKLDALNAGTNAGFAKLENGTLFVNYKALDGDMNQAALKEKVENFAVISETDVHLWEHDGREWNEHSPAQA